MPAAIQSNMMQGVLKQVLADSGYGVELKGFHGPSIEKAVRLEELAKDFYPIHDFVEYEDTGGILVIALRRQYDFIPEIRKLATFRREYHKFFSDLPKFLAGTKAQFVDRMSLTGSLGSISLTLLYRPVDSSGV